MNKAGIQITLISILVLFLVGCGNTKGYIGADIESSKLSTIILSNRILNENPQNKGDKAFVASVDKVVVGSYGKGWPKEVKVKPGNHSIKLRYYPESSNKFHTFMLFGVVGAGILDQMRDKYYLTVDADFEEGKKYIVCLETVFNDSSKESIYVWVVDLETNKVVGGEKPTV
jgi:hypothetical protein